MQAPGRVRQFSDDAVGRDSKGELSDAQFGKLTDNEFAALRKFAGALCIGTLKHDVPQMKKIDEDFQRQLSQDSPNLERSRILIEGRETDFAGTKYPRVITILASEPGIVRCHGVGIGIDQGVTRMHLPADDECSFRMPVGTILHVKHFPGWPSEKREHHRAVQGMTIPADMLEVIQWWPPERPRTAEELAKARQSIAQPVPSRPKCEAAALTLHEPGQMRESSPPRGLRFGELLEHEAITFGVLVSGDLLARREDAASQEAVRSAVQGD